MKTNPRQTEAIPERDELQDSRERFSRILRPALLLALLFTFVWVPRNAAQHAGGGGSGSGIGTNSQNPSSPPPMDQDPIFQGRGMSPGGEDPIMHERRMKALNAQRQKSMVDDTNKLLRLTTELNEEVNGAHAQPLNSDQLRKVAEIEKLAKSVREKMSTSVGGSSPMLMQPGPIPIMQ